MSSTETTRAPGTSTPRHASEKNPTSGANPPPGANPAGGSTTGSVRAATHRARTRPIRPLGRDREPTRRDHPPNAGPDDERSRGHEAGPHLGTMPTRVSRRLCSSWASSAISCRCDDPAPLAQTLDDGGVRLAATLAHGLQPIPGAGALHLVEQRGHEPSTGATSGMADSHRPAVDIDLGHVGVMLLLPGQDKRRERLVDLDHVHVVQAELRLLESPVRCRN